VRTNPDLPGLPDKVRAKLQQERGSATRSATSNTKTLESPDALDANKRCGSQSRAPSEAITFWDRRSMKIDRVTGRAVPDETKRVPLLAYANPRPAKWPAADFIFGNRPFFGNKRMRESFEDGYAETLHATYPEVLESADFVLYWWHQAATEVRADQAQRFGFITTNRLRQTFARRGVQLHLIPVGPRGRAFPNIPAAPEAQTTVRPMKQTLPGGTRSYRSKTESTPP
jgi:hypothetical protein